jgi:uncharacterized protein (DUF2267 family)
VPVKMDRDEFFARVRREFPCEVEGGDGPLAQTVLQSLRHHITEGEWEDVTPTMPKHLAAALHGYPSRSSR